MGFGPEMLFMIFLGLVLLGPRRLHALLGHVARTKAQFDQARRSLRAQLAAELETETPPSSRQEILGIDEVLNRTSKGSPDAIGS
jgi:Sec-independent protein translocase protein TatA